MKLITFDWDQTLWNSWDVHVEAAQYAARQRDLPIPGKEWIASTFSEPFSRHMELIFPHDTREATKHYMEYYHSRVKVMGHLFDGVPGMLESLKARGCVLALLSDKGREYGSQELNATGMAGHFDVVLFRDGARQYKPNPEGLEQVIDEVSVARGKVLYVGDSYVDVQCARRAGVASAAALWGSVNADQVLKEQPDYVWHSVEDVIAALAPEMREG